ncbi:unnamed protein product [Fraxinus pennsylvanica]|uniref:Tobamovirus multiplication protein 2A n=1 Tax=Fraxinus pennsylvanica TaxID=56036 RepID=A0AAD1YTM4_9LAMI|nr:unnamed protein product [Fraxinus pennsylvanica]
MQRQCRNVQWRSVIVATMRIVAMMSYWSHAKVSDRPSLSRSTITHNYSSRGLLNFLLTLVGLAMVGYGIYLFVEYKNAASSGDNVPIAPPGGELVQLGRPMLMAVSLADSIFDKLPKAWFIYSFIGIGVILFVISCCGCIGTAARNGCCLTCALVFLLALIVRTANRPADYDSDDEYISRPGQQIRQPLINNRPAVTATGVPVTGTLDHLPSRSDAWSTRMREKYGLDTSEFTYNPSESNRYQQAAPQSSEGSSRCTIM